MIYIHIHRSELIIGRIIRTIYIIFFKPSMGLAIFDAIKLYPMKKFSFKSILFTLFVVASLNSFGQQIDTIRVGHQFKNFNQLSIGSMKYMIYAEREAIQRPSVLMNVKTERIEHKGKQYIAITHVWNGFEKKFNGKFYSLVEPKTFKPVIHIRETEAKGKEAYKFSDKALTALDTVSNNAEAGYKLELTEPIFNFEIDLETFSLLPLKKDYKAVLQFFHPGSTFGGPDWYEIEVIGSEEITLPGGEKLDTWVLFMDYNGTQPTKFWYTKKGHEFIKMEGDYNGTKVRKVRMF